MKKNIMFVDDSVGVLEALKWMFVDEHYHFFAFENPMEALRKMEETEFAVVVADQRMPEMKGTIFLEKIKENWPDTVRIIITAHADLDIALDAINRGNVYRFIFKPWDERELKLAVKSAVNYYELRSENKRLNELLKKQNDQLQELTHSLERKVEERTKEISHIKKKRRKLERKLQQAQKMEAIGTLAGGIAHDFNNILSAIIGFTELATLNVDDGSAVLRNLDQVLKASERAKDLASQILTFSRQSEQERKPIQIESQIKQALKLLRSSLPATIEIQQNIENNVDFILADPTQIHQVVMNLCTNAAHAMREEGGIMEVTSKPVELDNDFTFQYPDIEPGPYLKLTVTDTGYGISSEIINSIFDPYFTTKKKGDGTGLGLAVVYGIVKSYGGGITVQSELERGSTFNVYFPRIESKIISETKEAKPLPRGNECIIFLDDEQVLVEMVEQILGALGYSVVTHTNSLEALELFRSEPDRFDLVITDMTMPKMTGDKMIREVLKIRSDIPTILCTGYSEKIDKEGASELGVSEFVMKPLDMRNLAVIIRKVLDQKKTFTAKSGYPALNPEIGNTKIAKKEKRPIKRPALTY